MASFEIAVSITTDKDHEGGYQCAPTDRGNWTSGKVGVGELKGTFAGISAHEFPSLDIKNLTIADVYGIYKAKYWDPMYVEITDQSVCNKLFDLGVLFGKNAAVLQMQITLNSAFHLVEDGIFGIGTLMAINASEPASLLAAYKKAFVDHATDIGKKNPLETSDVDGWIRRINS